MKKKKVTPSENQRRKNTYLKTAKEIYRTIGTDFETFLCHELEFQHGGEIYFATEVQFPEFWTLRPTTTGKDTSGRPIAWFKMYSTKATKEQQITLLIFAAQLNDQEVG